MEPRMADGRSAYRSLLFEKSFRLGGAKGLAVEFQRMRAAEPQDLNEGTLNVLGHDLLQKGKDREAVSVFALNVELFPEYANGYDNLGEAWLKVGDKEKARMAYEKALKLDPGLASAKKALEELGKIK
jgi:Flp pilus assembly protein TadD